jgi:DNA-binding NarL/FixJ family response regulator
MSSVRVLIADDEPLFADALEALLEADGRVQVVGRAADGREAIDLARELEPDLVLMDLSMPGVDGFDATREVTADGGPRVLVLTGSDDPADVARARTAGAAGYLTKDQIAETLVEAILAAGGAPEPD